MCTAAAGKGFLVPRPAHQPSDIAWIQRLMSDRGGLQNCDIQAPTRQHILVSSEHSLHSLTSEMLHEMTFQGGPSEGGGGDNKV